MPIKRTTSVVTAARLEALYRCHARDILRYIRATSPGNRSFSDDADDVLQAAFLNVLQAMDNGRIIWSSGAKAYIRTVAGNVARNLAALRRRETALDEAAEQFLSLTVNIDELAQEVQAIRRFTARLSGRARDVYLLRFNEGLPLCEVARRIGVSRQTARSIERQLRREALRALGTTTGTAGPESRRAPSPPAGPGFQL